MKLNTIKALSVEEMYMYYIHYIAEIVYISAAIFLILMLLAIPVLNRIEYKRDCKKHDKEYADEIARRW